MSLRDVHIIGFGHKSGVGKDAAAQVLVDLGWTRRAFGDPIKAVLLDNDPAVAKLVHAVGWDAAKGMPSIRHRLDTLGQSVRRHCGTHVWIDTILAQAVPGTVIADVRMVEEAEAILALDGMVVRVDRDVESLHLPTETALDGWSGWSAVIENSGTLDDLASAVLAL